MEKVKIWQKDFVQGDIFVKQTVTGPALTAEELAELPEVARTPSEPQPPPVAQEVAA